MESNEFKAAAMERAGEMPERRAAERRVAPVAQSESEAMADMHVVVSGLNDQLWNAQERISELEAVIKSMKRKGYEVAPVAAVPTEPSLALASDPSALGIATEALRFYANQEHFMMHQPDAWDTVSGEPPNFYEDESNTATVEDGSVAKMALETIAGAPRIYPATPPIPAPVEKNEQQGLVARPFAAPASQQESTPSGWIRVEDQLPPENATVAIRFWPYNNSENSQIVGAAEHLGGLFYTSEGEDHHPPSHWFPLPPMTVEQTPSAACGGDTSPEAIPESSERAPTSPECAMCNDSGIVGSPPDNYFDCPDCFKASKAAEASALTTAFAIATTGPVAPTKASIGDDPEFERLLLNVATEHEAIPTFGADPEIDYRAARAALVAYIDTLLAARKAETAKPDWISVKDQLPPEDGGFVLVTNNINAKTSFGNMSHVWLAMMIHPQDDGSFAAFAHPSDSRVENITHWAQIAALTTQRKGE